VSFRYLLEDGSGSLLLEDGASYYLLEQALFSIPSASVVIDVYDNEDGSVKLAWQEFSPIPPDSYDVYVNGVLNQNVVGLLATVTGLQQASYNPSVSPGPAFAPPNIPPPPANAAITPPGTYTFKVVAVYQGVEIAASLDRTVTLQPTSIMLKTPMRRITPFGVVDY
jgi:hypothetical protein